MNARLAAGMRQGSAHAAVLLAAVVLLASCRTPPVGHTQAQDQQTNAVGDICDLETSMTNLVSSLFEEEDLLVTSASERRRQKLQEEIKMRSAVQEQLRVSPEVRAEALYWSGISYLKLGDSKSAYRMFKELTWDYPGSRWAGYVRGLTEAILFPRGTVSTNASDRTVAPE